MNVLQVNNTDLPGKIFNGYNLSKSLKNYNIETNIIVKQNYDRMYSLKLQSINQEIVDFMNINNEHLLSINNLLGIGGGQLSRHSAFSQADIIHYHLIHNHLIPLMDLPTLMQHKASVWTAHDPWIITGHCIHPLDCQRWKTGCIGCERLNAHFSMRIDTANQMWRIKQSVYKELKIDLVVSSEFMLNYITDSPLGESFKSIHKIPFGLEFDDYEKYNKADSRADLCIPKDNFVIGFRNEEDELKGAKYVCEMLENMSSDGNITVITLGHAKLPEIIKKKYHTIELGWQNNDVLVKKFYSSCSIFIMPSLAESFGLMAIEAMASGAPVIVFESTVLPEITYAPNCGIKVPYKSSAGLIDAVMKLKKSPHELEQRSKLGKQIVKLHYKYSDYVEKHVQLYQKLFDEKYAQETKVIIQTKETVKDIAIEQPTNAIRQVHKYIMSLFNGKSNKLAILGMDSKEQRLAWELKQRLVQVNFFVDYNKLNTSNLEMDGIQCITLSELEEIKREVVLLVQSHISEEILLKIKEAGIHFVQTEKYLEKKLMDEPPIEWITELNYFKQNKKNIALVNILEEAVFHICQFYMI